MIRTATGLALAALLAGCGASTSERADGTPAGGTQPAPSEPVSPATESLLPRGTEMVVILQDTIDAEKATVGDRFTVRVSSPINTAQGRPVIPEGTVLTGLITGVDDSDHAGDPAYVRLNFVRMTLEKANHPFAAEILGTSVGTTGPVEDAEKSATAGAVAGAVIGAVISGDLRGAIEGASMGGGAGTIISLGTKHEKLPAGTVLRIRTTASVSLAE